MKELVTLTFCIIFTATFAFADGDGPMRKMNGSEARAFHELQGSLKASLPAIPANYSATYSGFDTRDILESITPDRMNSMVFKAQYSLNPEVKQSRQQAALTDLTMGTPEQKAKRADLEARAAQLKQARKNTRDPAEKEKIRAQLKKINAEENSLTDEIAAQGRSGWSQQVLYGVDKTLPAKQLSLQVLVNQNVHIQDNATPYPLQGAVLAFEQNDKCQDFGTYCITVLLGNFEREKKISGTTQYTLQNARLGVPTKPRGMAIIVAGPKDKPESARNLLKQINLAKLQALLP